MQQETTSEAVRPDADMRRPLARAGTSSLAIKAVNMALALGIAVVLSRALGPGGYGVYAYAFAVLTVLMLPLESGFPQFVVRETARAHAEEDWRELRAVWGWSARAVAIGSLAIVVLALGVAYAAEGAFPEAQISTFLVGLALVPLVCFGRLFEATLQGLRHIVLGQLGQMILRPGLLLLFALAWWLLDVAGGLTPARAMLANVAAAAIALVLGLMVFRALRPREIEGSAARSVRTGAWLASILPFALIGGMQKLNSNVDLLLLGIMREAADVGVYRVAAYGGLMVVFVQSALSLSLAPYLARLFRQQDKAQVQRIVRTNAQVAFGSGLAIFIAYAVVGKSLLSVLFGVEFEAAHGPLLILAAGFLGNSVFGPVGLLLNMTGHENRTARAVAIGTVCNIVLNLALIPAFGTYGAAAATAISTVVWNAALTVDSFRLLRINCMIAGPRLH